MIKRIQFSLVAITLLVTACGGGAATPESTVPPTSSSLPASPTLPAATATPEIGRTATFAEVDGDVQAREGDTKDFAPAADGLQITAGGQVRTGEPGRARLDLTPDATIVRLGPSTEFTLTEFNNEPLSPMTKIQQAAGQLWIILTGGELQIETEVGTASVRGSLMGVLYDSSSKIMTATCLEGDCSLSNDAGKTDLTDGQASDILGVGQAPSPARPISEEEYRQWLENNPEAAGLPAPVAYGLPPVGNMSPIDPNDPWPPSPTQFQVTYPDLLDDTENCLGGESAHDSAADIVFTTVYDPGGGFIIVDVLVYAYSDSEYDVYVTLSWHTTPITSMTDYLASIRSEGITLEKRINSGGPSSYAPGEMFLTGQSADGKRLFRFIVEKLSDSIYELVVSLYHLTPEPDVCDHQSASPSEK